RTGGNLRRVLHHLHLAARLVQTHVVQQVVEGDKFIGRLRALANLGTDGLDPLHQAVIKSFVGADGVVDTRTALDQAWQNVVDVADGEGVVRAVFANCTVLPGT